MWYAFKKHDGEVVVASSLELKAKIYKLFWMGGKERSDGVGIFVAEKWVDSVVSVKRHSERVLILKIVLGTHTHTTVLRLCGICPGKPG